MPRAARRSLEDILTRALLAYFAETPPHAAAQAAPDCAPPLPRLVLIAHPGLASDCLRGTLSERGYSVAMYSLYEIAGAGGVDADLVILSMSQYQPEALAVIRQRVEEIRGAAPDIPIMAMIENAEREAMRELAALGLAALVLGPLSARIALATIHLVLLGGSQVTAEIRLDPDNGAGRESCRAVAADQAPRDPIALENFTGREVALLTRLREGMQNKVIAHELGIAESTVKVHLRNIMAKLHASNRTQVASMLAGAELLRGHGARLSGDLDPVPVRGAEPAR